MRQMKDDEDDSDTGFTAVERRQKHADRRRLTQLRREQKIHAKKRKVLKMDDDDWTIDNHEGDDESPTDAGDDIDSSIRDLEFRLKNDVASLQQQQNDNRKMTLRDMTLLKVILCSGLYPQVAIADEHNSFKRDSDQVFHSRSKGFVLLHPTSVFCNCPESLQLKESQVKEPKRSQPSNRGQLSNGHQLVAFASLVETTKPYLVGAMRVPALPTLLLFAQSIDTNADCSRLVCDGWLEVTFESAEDAQSILSAAVKLRTAWQRLLNDKLEVSGRRRGITEGDRDRRHRAASIQSTLRAKLAEFLHTNVYYWIRRIHAAEQSHLYRGCVDVSVDSDDQTTSRLMGLITGGAGSRQHPVKGGRVVAGGILVYDCLLDDETSSVWGEYTTCLQRHWTCPRCEQTLIVTIGERLEHEQQCEEKQLEAYASQFVHDVKEQAEQSRTDAIRKPYRCSSCNQQYNFTTTEALKHKKNCSGNRHTDL